MEENKLKDDLIETIKQKEKADKLLLKLEWVIGYISVTTFFVLLFVAIYLEMPIIYKSLLIAFGSTVFYIGMTYALKIEQMAGYYKCRKCEHTYIPSYISVLFAMHIGRTRYMKCPKCNKRSWNKKVLTK